MRKHFLRQEDVIKLAGKLTGDKAKIEQKFARGLTLIEVAMSYKVPVSTFKRIARAVEIELPTQRVSSTPKMLIRDMLTVIVRIADELKVDYSELKPYLEEQAAADEQQD